MVRSCWCLSLALALAACAGAPALQQPLTWSFEDVADGKLPSGFAADATRRVGPLASWEVTASRGCPSGKQALCLTYPNHKQYDSFNLCWTRELSFGDGTLAVSLCARSGEEDQGGGLIWRAQSPDDYYIARLNPLESNLRLYKVIGGNREMLADAKVTADLHQWVRMQITMRGTHMTVAIDGKVLLQADDQALPKAGGVGVWTKADAATDFDDLTVH